MVPRYEFVLDCGSLYIHKWMGVASKTTVVPLNMALMACELLSTCKELLDFIDIHELACVYCFDKYPTLRKAREVVKNAEDGNEESF